MTGFTDAFGTNTLPPAEFGFKSFTLTNDLTLNWPYNSSDAATTLAKIMEVSATAGLSITTPDATQVSPGEDFLIRNIGAESITVKNAGGTTIATVAAGAAVYFYLTLNTTSSGVFSVVAFGVGTSTVDAASLVGYGIKAIDHTLNQSHPSLPTATDLSVGVTHRARLLVYTGGAGTFSLGQCSTLGDDFFFLVRNEGTGMLALDPNGSELIDNQATLSLQPGESLMLVCTGSTWYSVGYGRSVYYNFTQLTKDLTAGGTITLTAAEASNKLLTFIGSPAADVTVVVPAQVSVYYTYSNLSTPKNITLKTSSGSGTLIPQGQRVIAICDGTNVLSAQSAVSNSSLSLTDGSVAVPSLYFATQTNTGLYKYGANGIGFAVNGVDVFHLDGATIGVGNLQVTGSFQLTGDQVQVSEGGTGAADAGTARTNLGISATNTPFTPTGGVAATNVQAAIAELDSDKLPATTGSAIQKADGFGGLTAAASGTDYLSPSAIGVSVQAYDATILKSANIGSSVQGYDADTMKSDVETDITGAMTHTPSSLTDGANIDWNLDTQQNATVTLGGNRVMNAPSNAKAGRYVGLRVVQDGTGGRTLTFASAYKGMTGITPVTTASAVNFYLFRCIDTTNLSLVGFRSNCEA